MGPAAGDLTAVALAISLAALPAAAKDDKEERREVVLKACAAEIARDGDRMRSVGGIRWGEEVVRVRANLGDDDRPRWIVCAYDVDSREAWLER